MCFKIKSSSVPSTSLTARDIVPQTDSAAPTSPVFGSADFSGTKKKTGKDAMKIDLDTDASSSNTTKKQEWYF